MTAHDGANAQGEHAASAAQATEQDAVDPVPVDQVAAWVPAEHRDAYLDGVASVLGYRPRVA